MIISNRVQAQSINKPISNNLALLCLMMEIVFLFFNINFTRIKKQQPSIPVPSHQQTDNVLPACLSCFMLCWYSRMSNEKPTTAYESQCKKCILGAGREPLMDDPSFISKKGNNGNLKQAHARCRSTRCRPTSLTVSVPFRMVEGKAVDEFVSLAAH